MRIADDRSRSALGLFILAQREAATTRWTLIALEVLGLAMILGSLALLPAIAHGADSFSTSVMRPSAVPATGVIAGEFPAGETRYYFAIDVQPGDLMTQVSFAGREGARKEVELELLDASARASAHYWVHGEEGSGQATRGFPIDADGKQVFRLRVKGPETGRFCLELGGKAFPTTGGAGCPAPPAEAATKPAVKTSRAGNLEISQARCEERLRIGSDLFFDFDSAALRTDAEPTLAEVSSRLAKSQAPVAIEGHTDAKGEDAYNQRLSEDRASSVKSYLAAHGTPATRLTIVGWGERKPVAPNAKPDGADDPDGRQKNRRVEIVINTCA
jgi:outer membrane protein OmpA-like peptidoglycan-associated protein